MALAAVAVVILVSFRDPILRGLVAYERDTQVFFYPLTTWFAEELKAGRFPLWTPYIFAGYPLFADGENGLANPLNLIMLKLLPVAQTLIWMRVSSVLIASGGMYALCRALRVGPLAGFIGAVSFGLGSFFPSQQHHENVTRTAAWLPLTLACVEWALQRRGWPRHALLTAAALALGMATVGLHPQILAIVLIGFSTFVAFRCLFGKNDRPFSPDGGEGTAGDLRTPTGSGGERATPHRARGRPWTRGGARGAAWRLLLTAWVGLYVGLLGLALGAVQLVPLAQLGAETYRGGRPVYFFATSYALPIPNLVDLLFPYFFRLPNGDYWSLWAKWETELYVGVAPLILGLFAVVVGRRRMALYFLLLAVGALWLGFASYAPFDLYRLLWDLPGFSAFRVPGRYTYLFVLAWSALAALGAQTLVDARFRGSRRDRALAIGLLLALLAGSAILLVGMRNLRASLLADPSGAIDWINAGYLQLRHHLEGLTAQQVYEGLTSSLDPANARTAFGIWLLATSLILTAGALIGRWSRDFWRVGLAALTVVDVLAFGSSLHQSMPVGQLAEPTPAIRFLAGCGQASPCRAGAEGSGASVEQQWRTYTPGSIPSLEFNQLVPFRVADIGGYASPDLRRNFAYWANLNSVQGPLVDIANVRYVVYPAQRTALPSYGSVPFDPDHPLMLGSMGAVGGVESYSLGGAHGNRVEIIAALNHAVDVPQDAVVLQLTVVPRQGEPQTLELRAGPDLSETAYDRPDIAGKVRHQKAGTIAFDRPDVFVLDGSTYQRHFYYSEKDLARPMDVDHIELRYVYPVGGVEVYGIGLLNFDTGEVDGVLPEMRTKLRQVYADDDVRIFENTRAFPRAYVVPRYRVAPEGEEPLSAMLDAPFDATSEVMLDTDPSSAAPPASGQPPPGPGSIPRPAEATFVAPDRVVYRVSSLTSGYFVQVANLLPGWRAWVDGRETPILSANSLFRAVPIPPGDHTVELRYEPLSVTIGLRVTIAALTLAAVGLLLSLIAPRLARRRS